MKKNLIRVFVNRKTVIEISPFASVYSLKTDVQKKIYDTLPIDKINLHYNGKPMFDDNKAIISYGVEDNSNIEAKATTKGGSNSLWWLKILYVISIPFFILFLISGLPPVFSNSFAYVFDNTLASILNHFGGKPNDPISKIIRGFFNVIMWVVTKFATIIFIWVVAAYMVFPAYYLFYGRSYCDSGIAAKHVGYVTMIWYMIIYGSFNVVDFILNILQFLSDEDPIQVIKATTGPTIQSSKESWDIMKFAVFYAIPFVGEGIAAVHELIEEGVGLLYEGMDTASQFQCDNENIATELCSFLTVFKNTLKTRGYKSKGHSKHAQENENIAAAHNKGKSHKNKASTKASLRINKMNRVHDKRKKCMASCGTSSLGSVSMGSQMMAGELVEPVKNYRLGPLLNLLQRGFCDISIKDKIKNRRHAKNLKPLTEKELNAKLPPLPGTPYDMNTKMGRLNRWSTGFVTSFFCQLTEALSDITNLMWGIGTEVQVVNMIKTGQIAGIVATVALIIDTFLN